MSVRIEVNAIAEIAIHQFSEDIQRIVVQEDREVLSVALSTGPRR